MIWYMIKGFNGYEINEKGQVRSMKMMNADPGHLLKLNNGYYTLSDNQNKRVRRTPQQLLDIVFNNGLPLIPRNEEFIYMGGRNKRFYFNNEINNKRGENQIIKMDYSKFIVEE